MLRLNDEPFMIPANRIAELKKKFRFPMKVVYLPSMITYDGKNKRPNKPASINIPCYVSLKTKQGIERWRYAENMSVNSQGKTKFTPNTIHFTGDMDISEMDIERAYFFYYISPYCANGDLEPEQRKRPRFMILDDRIKATELTGMKQNRVKVEALIYDDDIGLSEHHLKVIAKSFFIPGLEDKTKNEVRILLDTHLHMIKNGYAIFLERSKGVELLQGRVKIQVAIDNKILGFTGHNRTWSWILPDGKKEDICRVTGGADYLEALHDFMVGDEEFANRLEAELTGKKVIGIPTSTTLEPGGGAEKIE